MSDVLKSVLQGSWTHSYEEDSGNLMVLRPSTYSFPPSRGRYQYHLEEGGHYQIFHPGPADKPEATDGTWTFENDGILMFHPKEGGSHRFRVISVDSERMVITRL